MKNIKNIILTKAVKFLSQDEIVIKFLRIRKIFMKNYNRGRIRFFAKWANLNGDNSNCKHSLNDGTIVYNVKKNVLFSNHIEMSGFWSSTILSYGNDSKGNLRLMRHVVFPTLRRYPNKTHSSFDHNFKGISLLADKEIISEKAIKYEYNGAVKIISETKNLIIERVITTARNKKACIEIIKIFNKSDKCLINVKNNDKIMYTPKQEGANSRIYKVYCEIDKTEFLLDKGDSVIVNIAYCASEHNESMTVDVNEEYMARMGFISSLNENLIIESPDNVVNEMAKYAKIRAAESIYKTKNGLMHCPGGGGFYAAIWTNDQCEYVNPFFAYLGYDKGIEQSVNCYNLYKKYIYKDKPLVTSIIAEGDDIWHGAKDRGDSAMYAYGASRFLLTLGDKNLAKEFLKPIRDCMEYTLSQINSDGVVKSDSDELENRFESGSANLSTSCLAYDALISCSYLENEFGNIELKNYYIEKAKKLKESIENYFGKNVEGFETYIYCKEEKKLRSWICLPLAVGIYDRADETVKALNSNYLRKHGGLVTRSGETTFWDRSTLYALRGMFAAGKIDDGIDLLENYSKARLLGNHIPYAVEAFPEGNQAQLSAESGLYIRIFIEGLLGYRPIGFNKFLLKPSLPAKWSFFKVKKMHIGSNVVDISIQKQENRILLYVNNKEFNVKNNEEIIINLN